MDDREYAGIAESQEQEIRNRKVRRRDFSMRLDHEITLLCYYLLQGRDIRRFGKYVSAKGLLSPELVVVLRVMLLAR